MGYKFEKLEVWQLSLEYTDLIYTIAEQLPRSEDYNLKSQIIRAGTGISLNEEPEPYELDPDNPFQD